MGIINLHSLLGSAVRRRQNLRLGGPSVHHRHHRRNVLRRCHPDGLRHQLRLPHGGPLRHRHRCRVRPLDRPRLHCRSLSRRLPGFLTSFPEVFINCRYYFLSLHLGWRFMLGLGAIPSVFLELGVLAMSESPRWLILQGLLGDTMRVLDKTSDSKEEAQLRLADIKEAAGIPEDCNNDVVLVLKRSQGEGVWKELILLPTPTVLYILIASVGIHFFQQASGIDAVVLYNPKIFEKARITSKSDKLLATVAVGFTKTILILVATFLLDRVGRRPYDPVPRKSRFVIDDHRSLEEESGVGSCFGNHDGAIVRRNILDWDGGHRMGLQLGDFSIKVAGTRDQHESRSPP
ncbi:hypothetical protein HYC85_007617 [Camellia sinensis]|uniref:Major facilitator superfamily (MFS) profile domain-containing protein n=1 Tax=Camellia sinensis TaxID=4442 RepID=A0A7J7HRB6_CAMSI|nr:hypothetical protein HYC85_007617 [Camellia sinensis]